MKTENVEAANNYQAYMRGWKNGACVNAMDTTFTKRADDDPLRLHYEAGYEAGGKARSIAANIATVRTGHKPEILRTNNG